MGTTWTFSLLQWWALEKIGARPVVGKKKKGADRGIDGVKWFLPDLKTTPERCIVQVKGGKVGSDVVRDLCGVVEREQAPLGVLITLNQPTREMRLEVAVAGSYAGAGTGRPRDRIQIGSVADLFAGKRPDIPWEYGTFPTAPKLQRQGPTQRDLFTPSVPGTVNPPPIRTAAD